MASQPPVPSFFSIYGMRVCSQLPLPCIRIDKGEPDVEVYFEGMIPRVLSPPPKTLLREWKEQNNHWLLRYLFNEGHILEFLFDLDGKRIRIRQSYPDWQNSVFVLLMPALAAYLHLQGKSIVHVSSLVRHNESFLVAGVNGSGKSSLAGALVAEGLALHSDDIGVVAMESLRPVIQAGYPRLKITLQTAAALGWNESSLKTIFFTDPEYEEKWLDVSSMEDGFHDSPAPLRAIYILSHRSAEIDVPQIEPLPAGQGALALTPHLYGDTWLQRAGRRTMSICAQLADSVPVFSLRLPEGLNRLRSSARFIVRHMETLNMY